MKKNRIDEVHGWGEFTDSHSLVVRGEDDARRTVEFENCVIATGATTRLLPGTAVSDRVVTYEEQILSDTLPGSVLIVGAGAIGVEFAYIMNSYGVDVTIVEFLDRLLPLEDREVSAELARQFARAGIAVHTSSRVESIDESEDKVTVVVSASDGRRRTFPVEKVLQAVGFSPRVDGYGLERTGVRLTERGVIAIDHHMRTNVPNIWAIGDVTGRLLLAHVAEAMGVVAAETIAGAETMTLDYTMMPRATFCQPQVASFGLTEEQARERGHGVKVVKFPFTANPTLSEAVKEALHGLAGHMINM